MKLLFKYRTAFYYLLTYKKPVFITEPFVKTWCKFGLH